jgi:hypothetical protein
VKGRIFLLGDRGLRLLDEQHRRVVDATPFTAESLPTKLEPAPETTPEPASK